ncbi:MAG: pyruvoyl-dependent arginine decarboxylase [Nanoarchaeota archaeon]
MIKKSGMMQDSMIVEQQNLSIIVGNRIPRSFFWTSGIGESDITVHAGSYHLALKEAGIERYNIMVYSSIMPAIAIETEKPSYDEVTHGSVLESITAVASGKKGTRLTAGIIYGWLFSRKTGKKYGGLVAEYNGNDEEGDARDSLKSSLKELYENGFSEEFELRDTRIETRSFVPKKNFGTALVAIGFKDYVFPIIR